MAGWDDIFSGGQDPTLVDQWMRPPPQQPKGPLSAQPWLRGQNIPGPPSGLPTQMVPPQQPLPSWMNPVLQNYIRNQPSYAEGQTMPGALPPPTEPWGYSNPQADDIRRLFASRIMDNAPKPVDPAWATQLRSLMRIPGFSGFTGGTSI